MVLRSPALRASRSKPYILFHTTPCNLVQAGAQHHPQPRISTPRNCQTRTTFSWIRTDSPSILRRSKRRATGYETGRLAVGKRRASSVSQDNADSQADREAKLYALIDKISTTEAEILELLDDLDITDRYSGTPSSHGQNPGGVSREVDDFPDEHAAAAEQRVRIARQQFGESIPEGYLDEEEILLYSRLYGEPIIRQEESVEVEEEEEGDYDQLLRDDGRGGWEEVPHEEAEMRDEIPMVYDMEHAPPVEETATMRRAREVAEQLGAEIAVEPFEDGEPEGAAPRIHPLTLAGKGSTDPATIFPPKDTLTGPISIMLGDYSNKHIAEAAHGAFGGQLLPHSTTTPPADAHVPRLPIPLEASQRYMSDMEANAYLAVLYPGMYASVLSVLTETRKRLGSDWIRPLISQEGGPNILDANAGGAGVLAWRDVLRAEWELMVPDHPKSTPYPLGRSTVVTGSDALRLRASVMLENTTFLPRLPDYIHVREGPTVHDKRPPQRKQFDIIIAPHALLGIEQDFLRKEYVENLWQLLNPNGGVLVLLEKGHQGGFEAVAGAREMLLKRYISSPGSTEYNSTTESPGENPKVPKEPGMIIAPCTNHERCPMYQTEGHAKSRKDYCHFQQRYIRPPFHQRIIGATGQNHEDLKFSYLAVQRGVDLREDEGISQGVKATDAAFKGYEHLNETVEEPEVTEANSTPKEEQPKFHTISLPRVVYSPIKRRGHVILDLCTPAGKIERWTVPRSYSRQAYKDARKSQWGDLWALGAKTRIPRTLKLGDKHGEGKKERLARRAAARAALEDEGDDEDQGQSRLSGAASDLFIPPKKKGEHIPSWKKRADKKKVRQASKKHFQKNFE